LLNGYKNVLNYINTNFDFNICKNIYSIDNGKHNLYIDNLPNIMNKIISGKILGTAYKFGMRKVKYENRGFTFQNNVIGNHIYYNGKIIPILILNTHTKQVTLFEETVYIYDKCYTKCNFNNKYSVKIEGLDEIKKYCCHTINCSNNYSGKTNLLYNCPINCLDDTIKHYHAKLMVGMVGTKDWTRIFDAIVIENSENDMLKLHNNYYDMDGKYNDLFIDFDKFCKKNKI
jgi:hypothetical protein